MNRDLWHEACVTAAMTSRHPVHYRVARPAHFSLAQLGLRFVAFIALGVLGLSFGAVLFFTYLALPIYAAIRLGSRDRGTYVREDGPRILAALRWLAAVCAWTGLTLEHLPARRADEVIILEIESNARDTRAATTGSALLRVLTGFPSALVLSLLGFFGAFVWLWSALTILFTRRVGDGAWTFMVGLQRWSLRLLVYQASLVDDYPPFALGDDERDAAPAPSAP